MPDLEEGGRLTETAAIGGGTHPTTSTIPQQPTEGEYDWVPTDPTSGLTSEQVAQALARYGPNEIPVPDTPLYLLFVRQFVGFLPFLIELAAIVSLAVQDYIDFGIILGILLVNGCLGFREEYHAKKSLQAVSASLDSEIAVRRDGLTASLLVKQLVPGDIVFLVGGTIVPADVLWISGDVVQLDTAALTGEPLPRKYPSAEHGRTLLSGTTVTAGECYGQVLRIGTATEIGQAQVDILQDKSVRIVSVFQQKIMKVVQMLIAGSLIVVLAVLLVKGIVYDGFDDNVKETILDALSILIASIPVALPLVVQVNLALGASFLAKEHHAIVTSIPALQDIASMSMLCSDKTGTLTTANMSVIPEQVFAAEGFTTEQVLLYAYLCSNPDKKDDPIDRAVVAAFLQSAKANEKDDYVQTEIIGFNPTVKRVVAFVGHGNETITIAKGLPAKIVNTQAGGEDDHELQWQVNRAADRDFLDRVGSVDTGLSKAGYKTIGIGVCFGNARTMKNPVWKFAGLVPMLDPPREDTRATIESLHHANISIKMITGDHQNVGKETARLIGLGTDIRTGEEIRHASSQDKKRLVWEADGFAAVLPSDKREVVMILRNEYGIVTGMTGDGVNDAPALSAAQVGIAVEGATDAAKNAADLILTEPGLSPIYGAVLESRRIFLRIKGYVIYRVAASIIMVLTLSIIIFASGCAVDSLLVIILALLNDISMIPVAYDNASATTKPQLPRASKLVLMSLYYGICQTALGLSFIFIMDHAKDLDGPIALNRACSSETRGFIWFHLTLVTELMIFSVRAPGSMLYSKPSIFLIISVLGTCAGSAFIAMYGSDLSGLNVVWILLFNLGTLVLVDFGKIMFRALIGEEPGDIIANDELLSVPPIKTETAKNLEKKLRYVVHNESLLEPEDRQHMVQVRRRRRMMSEGFFSGDGGGWNQGFVDRRRVNSILAQQGSAFFQNRGDRSKQTTMPW